MMECRSYTTARHLINAVTMFLNWFDCPQDPVLAVKSSQSPYKTLKINIGNRAHHNDDGMPSIT